MAFVNFYETTGCEGGRVNWHLALKKTVNDIYKLISNCHNDFLSIDITELSFNQFEN